MTEKFQIRKPRKFPTTYERWFNSDQLKKILLDYMRQNGADIPEVKDWRCGIHEASSYSGESCVSIIGEVFED